MTGNGLKARQTALIEVNLRWLHQALDLLDRIGDTEYSCVAPGLAPHRASGHLRHIVEFYECFLDGIEWCHIDYDARKRDTSMETDRAVAAARIRRVIAGLVETPELLGDGVVWVRMEDSDATDCFMTSSIGRELQMLSSHTIHHFALMAVALRAHSVAVDPDFGMAPSTLRFQRETASVAAVQTQKGIHVTLEALPHN